MKKIVKIIIAVFVIAIIWIGLEFSGFFSQKGVSVTVEKGDTYNSIVSKLEEQGVIHNKLLFKVYSKLFHRKEISFVKPGTLVFDKKISYEEIINKLTNNKSESVSVTIPEGYELREIADLLEKKNLIDKDKFYDIVKSYDFSYPYIKELKKTENRLEGFLFPDTYSFQKDNDNELVIVETMLKRFDDIIKKYEKEINNSSFSVYETVTLASVIEREAMFDEDFYDVSSVFHNRLKRKDNLSYLQSCATVQYILKERKKVLTVSDTKIDSPYNTYKYPGLPEGPISSPGEKAIKAALNPNKNDYLYFLNDKDGHLHFSKTYEEHKKAVNKYVN